MHSAATAAAMTVRMDVRMAPLRFRGASRRLAGRSLDALGGFDNPHLGRYRPDGNRRGIIRHGREVVIVEAVRSSSGAGTPEKGTFKDVHPAPLLARTYARLLARGRIDAEPTSRASLCARSD
jgi:hypothetical protein